MKKKLLVMLLCIATIALLAGCGNKTASNSELKEDLYNSECFTYFAKNVGMKITDLEVVKRQTTKTDKVDNVWVKVEAAGDTAKGEMYYEMVYELYNDGWKLESVEKDESDSWHFEPLCGASDDIISPYVPEGAEITESNVDLDNLTHTVNYTYTEPHTYCDITYKKQLVFEFGGTSSSFGTTAPGIWAFSDTIDTGSYEDWSRIKGTWEYNSKEYRVVLVIDDLRPAESVEYTESGGDLDVIEFFELDGSYTLTSSQTTSRGTYKGYDSPLCSDGWKSDFCDYFFNIIAKEDASSWGGYNESVYIYYDKEPEVRAFITTPTAKMTKVA